MAPKQNSFQSELSSLGWLSPREAPGELPLPIRPQASPAGVARPLPPPAPRRLRSRELAPPPPPSSERLCGLDLASRRGHPTTRGRLGAWPRPCWEAEADFGPSRPSCKRPTGGARPADFSGSTRFLRVGLGCSPRALPAPASAQRRRERAQPRSRAPGSGLPAPPTCTPRPERPQRGRSAAGVAGVAGPKASSGPGAWGCGEESIFTHVESGHCDSAQHESGLRGVSGSRVSSVGWSDADRPPRPGSRFPRPRGRPPPGPTCAPGPAPHLRPALPAWPSLPSSHLLLLRYSHGF